MNFKGHLNGGLVAATAVSAFALLSGTVSLEGVAELATGDLDASGLDLSDLSLDSGFGKLLLIFAVTLFMALFPDLDTASITQRWFYRVALVVVVWLYMEEQSLILYLFAVSCFLPLLHQHRGWTHWVVTPWLISVVMAFFYEYHQSETSWFHSFSLEGLQEVWLEYGFFVFAAVVGHYTHLYLDSKFVRLLGLHSSRKGHH